MIRHFISTCPELSHGCTKETKIHKVVDCQALASYIGFAIHVGRKQGVRRQVETQIENYHESSRAVPIRLGFAALGRPHAPGPSQQAIPHVVSVLDDQQQKGPETVLYDTQNNIRDVEQLHSSISPERRKAKFCVRYAPDRALLAPRLDRTSWRLDKASVLRR